jgi:hypothetical protein
VRSSKAARKSSSLSKRVIRPAARSLSAARSRSCHLRVQNQAAEGHNDGVISVKSQKSPAGAGLSCEAAEGIRTLDLLHGKQTL